MATQLRIIAIAFIVFGFVAWLAQSFSVAYIGLMIFGLTGLTISFVMAK